MSSCRPRWGSTASKGRQHHHLATLIFGNYVWAFEVTGALLITAALGAMVLAHRERLMPRPTQRELAERRIKEGPIKAPLPAPGVFARHNAVDIPALLPDGTPSELSVSRVLTARGDASRDELSTEWPIVRARGPAGGGPPWSGRQPTASAHSGVATPRSRPARERIGGPAVGRAGGPR